MIVGRWYVQLAAIWHWYLPLCVYITLFYFILYLSIPFLYFALTWYRQIRQNGWWYQHFLILCALLTGVILKGLTLWKFVSDVCGHMFYVSEVIGFVDWLVGWYICEKSLEMCTCLWPEFDCPEVTLCGWQNIKIELLPFSSFPENSPIFFIKG